MINKTHTPTDDVKPAADEAKRASGVAQFFDAPSYARAMKLARSRQNVSADPGSNGRSRVLRIALGGNCNMDFIRPALDVALTAEGFAPAFRAASYDGWVQEAIEGSASVDWWIVWISAMGLTRGNQIRREIDGRAFESAERAIERRGERLLVILPEALVWEDDPFSPFVKWRRDALRELEAAFSPGTVLLSIEHIQRRIGQHMWYAPRYWSLAKAPCHPDAATQVGIAAGRAMAQSIRPKIKAVMVDLDNTLWGGVVGDDGPEGLELDPDGNGRPYMEMQRFLKDLSQSGIPICVVSKNDPKLALRPFGERPEMILSRSDFVEFRASWDHKHKAIKSIVARLNLGMDSVCFIDDSAQERHEACTYLPELVVPELPADLDERVPFLIRTGLFGLPVLRDEDVRRVQMYKDEAVRRVALEDAPDSVTYLRSLDMRLSIGPVSTSNLSRAAALAQKTNQFNVTGRRSTSAELVDLASNSSGYVACSNLRDRFGDSGLIGVLAAVATDGKIEIVDWVLSCRVFGRGVEDAMFEHLLRWAKDHKISVVEVRFARTSKNAIVEDALCRVGFLADGANGDDLWTAVAPKWPIHTITLDNG